MNAPAARALTEPIWAYIAGDTFRRWEAEKALMQIEASDVMARLIIAEHALREIADAHNRYRRRTALRALEAMER